MKSGVHKWTEEEKAFLRKNYLTLSTRSIAARLGLTYTQVKNAVGRYGIKGKRREYTDRDVEVVTRLYADSDTKFIARAGDRWGPERLRCKDQ